MKKGGGGEATFGRTKYKTADISEFRILKQEKSSRTIFVFSN